MRTRLIAVALWAAASSAAVAGPVGSSPTESDAAAQRYAPLYERELDRARAFVDQMMDAGVVVPVPRDPGGGYTHEQHKRNYKAIYEGGQLYRITGEQQYADYVRDMLLAYADLYPTLDEHPARKNSQSSGRIFWQVLNDAMWMVHGIQGYEAIRDSLSEADRKNIDDNLFRKAAEFLSTGSAVTFSKIHNHATWATAGVGMTGYVLGDRELVDIALLGLDKSGETGFLRQSELLFSPDGYYTEGPYYQRFALKPFVVFAGVIEKNDPARKIFEHRDGILLKALRTTIQLTYDGYFFPFNDAIKDKSLQTDELYHGVAIAYRKTRDPGLLSIAQWQGRTVLTNDGKLVADDLAAGKAMPFSFKSLLLSDGPEGEQGAVAILREGDSTSGQALVAKNSSQGMGHGHFDKLSWQYYDNGNEIISDYGAARFLNIEAKDGGRYLSENESWAKQTIAHNTLVVDEKSHFDGEVKVADSIAPEQLYFSDAEGAQISSAVIEGAYPDTRFIRTLALFSVDGLSAPVALDIVRVQSDSPHQYDLPLHYQGHIMRVGFDTESHIAARPVLGTGNGYQHIWVDAVGKPQGQNGFVTTLLDGRFYTYRFVPQQGAETILAEIGANDPSFNLRREPIIIQRTRDAQNTTFVSLLESHGRYDGAAEQTVGSDSLIKSLSHESVNGSDIVIVEKLDGKQVALVVSYDSDSEKKHSVKLGDQMLTWTGFAARIDLPAGKAKR
ncbi:alginate lyase family protein [uncultured Parasphingorhabdus sp.]|uniref:alginate lyase family protein n=1 Tax=uncultured Parasphingorhabdus sp. TaxID=2709694 RepID=UPI002AA92174|nr:alginate lyase family protein [uncultured Parasphingorhabdus sp.]